MTQRAHTSVVAITGGMGSGKSSVAAYLCELGGAKGLNADTICRQLLEPGAAGWSAMRKVFGDRFFLADQHIDRPQLRKVLFEDCEFRHELDAILHPLARNEIFSCLKEEIGRVPSAQARFVVEVPLLYEAGWEHDFSQVVVAYADEKSCLRRIMLRDRISEAEAQKSIAAQMPLSHKALLADHVIDNSGPWPDTCLQIVHLRNFLWHERGLASDGSAR